MNRRVEKDIVLSMSDSEIKQAYSDFLLWSTKGCLPEDGLIMNFYNNNNDLNLTEFQKATLWEIAKRYSVLKTNS
ncbi:hypothetical protein [Paenibacillus polymyxa]|uniref:hypothetical protein n=1 Tax=Paenibacillus polymyxa TaxID=1406 RepID=UPI002AB3B58F|nr:hypothetical protein [Paenibacillus polymyxa]MDY8021216.1 hypothetical protein [Paenibacillus polymyxa]